MMCNKQAMVEFKVLAYLDHNVLDRMTKGDPDSVKKLLIKYKITAVFSDESLNEISRSVGYEDTFLALLKDIGAKYIVPVLDSKFKQTGKAEIRDVDPCLAYKAYIDNRMEMPDYGYGLTGMLQKFYGGRENQSFSEILSGGADELSGLLVQCVDELDDAGKIDKDMRKILLELPDILRSQYTSISEQVDKQVMPQVKQVEEVTGLSPKLLNNIKSPDVVKKIWELVLSSMDTIKDDLDLESFFGLKAQSFEPSVEREKTSLEKVNAIYHQLNFLGYYRDSNMKKSNRFTASLSDMTHAGVASFCHLFICRDKSLVRKAAAAYEYVGVATKILYYQTNKKLIE